MAESKTFAEFMVPGGFFSPQTIQVPVLSRDLQKLHLPKESYAVRFFDILSTRVKSGKSRKTVKVWSNPINRSPWHNIGTAVYTAEQIKKETAKERKKLDNQAIENRERLLREMKIEKLKYALKIRVGGFLIIEKNELVLLVKGKTRKVLKVKELQ